MAAVFLLLCISFSSLGLIGLGESASCVAQYSGMEEWKELIVACAKNLSLELSPSSFPNNVSLSGSLDYDQKCIGKCLMEAIGFLDEEGKFNRTRVEEDSKSFAPKSLQGKLTALANKCVDSTEEKYKEMKRTPENLCKIASTFMKCHDEEEMKLC